MKFVNLFKRHVSILAVLIVAGAVVVGIFGFNQGGDFVGSTLATLDLGQSYDVLHVEDALNKAGIAHQPVQNTFNANVAVIRVTKGDWDEAALHAKLVEPLLERYPDAQLTDVEDVSARFSRTTKRNVLLAAGLACLLIFAFVTIRFEVRSGVIALAAPICSGLALLSAVSLARLPLDLPIAAALLVTTGFTVYATVAIFDRLRENLKLYSHEDLTFVVNRSIGECLRPLRMTVLLAGVLLIAMLAVGVNTIRVFSAVSLAGLLLAVATAVLLCMPAWCLWTLSWRKKNKAKKTRYSH